MKIRILAIMAVLLAGCGTMKNRHDPAQFAVARMPADSAVVILSTGAPKRCTSTATFLQVMPVLHANASSSAVVGVDGSFYKSDFESHHGLVNVFTLRAGKYVITPIIANPYVKPTKVPRAEFSVEAGETVYLGEYFMPVSCSLRTWSRFDDKFDRDMAIVDKKNPDLKLTNVVTRIPVFSGD